jgi:uncharacterized protein with beta-barrel porin domain
MVFAQLNENAVADLLNRSLPDGGGDSYYNLSTLGGPDARVWARAIGEFQNGYGGSAADVRTSAGGLEGGADHAVAGEGRLGVALAYAQDRLTDGDSGVADQKIFRGSLYGSYITGPLGWSAVFSYAHGWDTVTRDSGFGPSTSSRGADEVMGAIQVAAPTEMAAIKVTPAVGVQFSHISSDAFAETNLLSSAFAVTGDSAHVSAISPYAQIGFSHAFVSGDTTIIPDLLVGYRYDEAANGGNQTLVAADGTVFTGNQVSPARSEAVVGASLTAHAHSYTAFIKYRATFSSQWSDQAVEAGLRVAF